MQFDDPTNASWALLQRPSVTLVFGPLSSSRNFYDTAQCRKSADDACNLTRVM
jgi:hypothetical protein